MGKQIKTVPEFYREFLLACKRAKEMTDEDYASIQYDFGDRCKTLFENEHSGEWAIFNKDDMSSALTINEMKKLDKLVQKIWIKGTERLVLESKLVEGDME